MYNFRPQAFDTVKEELQAARQERNINSKHGNSADKVKAFKRQAEGEGAVTEEPVNHAKYHGKHETILLHQVPTPSFIAMYSSGNIFPLVCCERYTD